MVLGGSNNLTPNERTACASFCTRLRPASLTGCGAELAILLIERLYEGLGQRSPTPSSEELAT